MGKRAMGVLGLLGTAFLLSLFSAGRQKANQAVSAPPACSGCNLILVTFEELDAEIRAEVADGTLEGEGSADTVTFFEALWRHFYEDGIVSPMEGKAMALVADYLQLSPADEERIRARIETPPEDRLPIQTRVAEASAGLVRDAILRELDRGGQAFYVHNRVETIEAQAEQLRRLLPSARIAVGHGQMPEGALEKIMLGFAAGEYDVLVSTTIIESGLDIPNANTIIIDNADRFGLAELHQLRGRVGRYKHRAYAHMLLPGNRSITPIAAKRLKAIEEYSHLGAGFRIALRDLEIRGAGNILGAAQSGHIQVVGYQMYCELLSNAVRRLKGLPVDQIPTAVVDLGFIR